MTKINGISQEAYGWLVAMTYSDDRRYALNVRSALISGGDIEPTSREWLHDIASESVTMRSLWAREVLGVFEVGE